MTLGGAIGRSHAKYLLQLVAVGAAYYVAAKLSLRISLVGGVVTPIWPPTGIAVVALLGFGLRLWPAVTLAAFLVNLPINDSVGTAALIAVGNTAAPLLAAWLLRARRFRLELDQLRDAVSLVFLGALLAMTVSATFGTTALLLDDTIRSGAYGSTWALWWAGDGTGVLVFAPVLLSLRWIGRLRWPRVLELVLVLGALAGVGYLVVRNHTQDAYLVFPLLIWAAVRFRQLGAALAALTVVSMAVWAAYDQVGPFANLTFTHRSLLLQLYDAVVALTSFVLAAVIAERSTAFADVEASLAREHAIAETLQRSLLPERLPDVSGLAFASRYIPGAAGLAVGGDWYDVILLPRGRVGLTVGDVVGRGIGAAATMGQLRTALHAYVLENSSPVSVLERMSRLAAEFDAAQMATLVYAVLDPESETLTYASAGHPPPLLLGPNGDACYLDDGRSLPLGLASEPRTEAVTTIAPGSTLILYTDGLVERRGGSIDEGMAALRQSVEAHQGDLDALCDERVLAARRPQSGEDDVSVLVTMLLPVAEDFDLRLPADPELVGSVRRAVRSWAARCGASETEIDGLVHAVSEAVNNVVEHAYGPTGGPFELHARHANGRISVVVRDAGQWRAPRNNEDHGRGFALMQGLADTVDVVRSPEGTEVRLQVLLGAYRSSEAAAPGAPRPRAPDADDSVVVVRLDGDIDLANATTLFHDVIGQVRHDSIGLVMDLSEVEHLDSAGLRLLFRVAQRLATHRQSFCVVAPPGSVAYRVLHVSGFDRFGRIGSTAADAEATVRAAGASSATVGQGF
ncbi:MAG: SpoIIE family protein phosphatase [Actinomycetes bacterium]